MCEVIFNSLSLTWFVSAHKLFISVLFKFVWQAAFAYKLFFFTVISEIGSNACRITRATWLIWKYIYLEFMYCCLALLILTAVFGFRRKNNKNVYFNKNVHFLQQWQLEIFTVKLCCSIQLGRTKSANIYRNYTCALVNTSDGNS